AKALILAPLLHSTQPEETKRRNDFATDESRREGDWSMSALEGKTAPGTPQVFGCKTSYGMRFNPNLELDKHHRRTTCTIKKFSPRKSRRNRFLSRVREP